MNFLKPNFKNAAIVTTVIFAQKIYRHPDEFAFVYSEGLTVSLFAIVGFASMFGAVCAFTFLGLALLNTLIEKVKSTKIYTEYRYYIYGFIFLSVLSYFLTP